MGVHPGAPTPRGQGWVRVHAHMGVHPDVGMHPDQGASAKTNDYALNPAP